jgi:putative serine protease PepD
VTSGKAKHAYLGIQLRNASSDAGARVVLVRSGTPAAKAGLRAGDVITTVAGKRVKSADELRAEINAHKPGDKISIAYLRGGSSHTADVTLAGRPS